MASGLAGRANLRGPSRPRCRPRCLVANAIRRPTTAQRRSRVRDMRRPILILTRMRRDSRSFPETARPRVRPHKVRQLFTSQSISRRHAQSRRTYEHDTAPTEYGKDRRTDRIVALLECSPLRERRAKWASAKPTPPLALAEQTLAELRAALLALEDDEAFKPPTHRAVGASVAAKTTELLRVISLPAWASLWIQLVDAIRRMANRRREDAPLRRGRAALREV